MTDDLYRRKWPEADNRVSRQYVKVEPLRESNLKTFIRQAWNPAKKEVFGRNAASWGKLLAFYFVFYLVIAITFALMLALFCELILDKDNPTLIGEDIPIAQNPGMSFRPQPEWETTLIRFDQANWESMKILANHMTAFLDLYENENQVGRNYIDCKDGKRSSDEPEKVCRFDTIVLGGKCNYVQMYSYVYGTPCILLKLNKVMGWIPQPYNESTIPQEMRSGKRSTVYRKDFIGITCEGVTDADKENIGDVEFYPNTGFPYAYYPYTGQEGYRAPLVMAYFPNIKMGMVVMVRCKAWAANIQHSIHDWDYRGSTRFEVLVD